ncbi:carbon monoxide dehydrogenase [Rhodococcus hoagii]|uniref:Carbon monoxide dehydrogenase n=2 Tax=Rhodococcus hoagii TaxID=43767 RepID=A0AAE5IRV8_RHOHA|nr:carbon monoxide dehydrogenase subunit G [Prescottella equi]ERN44831.1 carbon monoxide dehydrogenase subunit G [Prescottella equi NBRC 101255 = C 7]MBM4628304.1 carbon monoxide dehydrogenase [Prescottella equi]NKR33110.1 carbon monoxide dehydrogenase [Prescottella equi]NKR57186.1 carbon monoxide dehydrogenase [Prescottella equi]NKS58031.1 carbon monoxide dehydrogenase [Prescottella equi]
MRIAGTAQLLAPPEVVYDNLQDGRVLAATIPGVQSLEQLADNHYKLSITAGVASIKGTYDGEVILSQQNRPESFVLTASGSGAPGTVKADVTVRLEECEGGGTLLSYDADAVVGGMVGGVGQRMITGVAKKMAGVFFKGIDGVIVDGIPVADAPADVVEAAEIVAGASPAAPVASAARAARAVGASAVPARSGESVSAPALFASAAVGAALALTGVVVGGILARGGARR